MKKVLLVAIFICLLALPSSVSVSGEITGNITVGEDLFVTIEFKGLDQPVYEQARVQFNETKIPGIIAETFEQKNQTVGTRALPLELDDTNRTIRSSFYLGGSAVVTFTVNRTTLRRMYEVRTDWRKFKVGLTDGFSVNFAQLTAKPIAEWEKPYTTTFYLENNDAGALNVLSFNLVLPSSASAVRVEQDTVFFEMPPSAEDILLGTPFLIIIALAIALVVILLYRKVR